MKLNSTLIGLLVLGLVAAGVLWVRSRSPHVPTQPAALATQAAASSAATSAASVEGETLPDVTFASAAVDASNVRITLSLTPNPPVGLAKTRVRVQAESGGSPVALEGGRVTFEMTMPMGDHRYSLVAGQDGWQEAEVILPRCMSGKRRWFATVEGTVAGRPRTARFRLDLAPPG